MATYFVDFSASNDGDGTAYNQAASGGATGAYNTLVSKTFTSGDTVWLRRVTAGSDYTANLTFVSGVNYIGWPVSGDDNYSARPASAQASWDGDGGTQAKFSMNNGAANFRLEAGAVLHRLHFNNKGTSYCIQNSGTYTLDWEIKYCKIECSGASFASSPFIMSTTATGYLFVDNEIIINDWAMNADYLFYATTRNKITCYNLTVTIGTATPSGACYFLYASTNDDLYVNTVINIDTLAGTSAITWIYANDKRIFIYGYSINVTTKTGTINTYNTVMNGALTIDSIVKGFSANHGRCIYVGYCKLFEILDFTQTDADASNGCVRLGNDGTIIANNVVTTAGNTNWDFSCQQGTMFLKNCLFNSGTEIDVKTNGRVFSLHHGQVINAFEHHTLYGSIVATAVTRSGGDSYSLQVTKNGTARERIDELRLSETGQETIWLSLTSGARTITVYGAYKNYTTFTHGDVWIETEYLNASDDITQVTTYDYGTDITSDASSWSGDTGLTEFKMVLSFTLPSDQVVPLRIFSNKYESGGYFYIDPLPATT